MADQNKPKRDIFDIVTLITGIIGVVIVVYTTVTTQISAAKSDEQAAIALSNISKIAQAAQAAQGDLKAQIGLLTQSVNAANHSAVAEGAAASAAARAAEAEIGSLNIQNAELKLRFRPILTLEAKMFLADASPERPVLAAEITAKNVGNIEAAGFDFESSFRPATWGRPGEGPGRKSVSSQEADMCDKKSPLQVSNKHDFYFVPAGSENSFSAGNLSLADSNNVSKASFFDPPAGQYDGYWIGCFKYRNAQDNSVHTSHFRYRFTTYSGRDGKLALDVMRDSAGNSSD